jgi:hypothetical protein
VRGGAQQKRGMITFNICIYIDEEEKANKSLI